MCIGGKRHDSEFYKHSIDYISKFHASNLKKKQCNARCSVDSNRHSTAVKDSILPLGHSVLILDGSILVLFLFALFKALVLNERRKKATPDV